MSRVSLKVQRSLVKAENALQLQSRAHPHGWGIAYYLPTEREPRQVKSVESAFDDDRFARVSEFLTSHAVIAHVRKATVGDLGLENTHPFHWNGWSFCHNGTVFGFRAIQDELRAHLAPRFADAIVGDTDSETLFFLILTALEEAGFDVDQPGGRLPDDLPEILSRKLAWVSDLSTATGEDEREAMINVLLTNGRVLLATRFNGALNFSTQKRRCADFDICPIAEKVCFGPRRQGIRHTHVLLASDPTSSDDVWEEIPNRGYLTVDEEYHLRVGKLPGLDGPPAWYP